MAVLLAIAGWIGYDYFSHGMWIWERIPLEIEAKAKAEEERLKAEAPAAPAATEPAK